MIVLMIGRYPIVANILLFYDVFFETENGITLGRVMNVLWNQAPEVGAPRSHCMAFFQTHIN